MDVAHALLGKLSGEQALASEIVGRFAADTVKFVRNAQWRRLRGAQLADEVTGALITYNNLTDTLTVDGNNSKTGGIASRGRVRAMLTPKPEGSAPAVAPPANLRPATGLGTKK